MLRERVGGHACWAELDGERHGEDIPIASTCRLISTLMVCCAPPAPYSVALQERPCALGLHAGVWGTGKAVGAAWTRARAERRAKRGVVVVSCMLVGLM